MTVASFDSEAKIINNNYIFAVQLEKNYNFANIRISFFIMA